MKKSLINSLVMISNVEVTMNVEQFRAYRSGELNLLEIKMINDLDEELGWLIENDNKAYRNVVVGLAFTMTALSSSLVFASGLDSIDTLGNTFLNIVRRAMYWICLIKALVDVGKEVSRGGDNMGNIGKIIMKYVLAFATLYLLPWLFDLVKESF